MICNVECWMRCAVGRFTSSDPGKRWEIIWFRVRLFNSSVIVTNAPPRGLAPVFKLISQAFVRDLCVSNMCWKSWNKRTLTVKLTGQTVAQHKWGLVADCICKKNCLRSQTCCVKMVKTVSHVTIVLLTCAIGVQTQIRFGK